MGRVVVRENAGDLYGNKVVLDHSQGDYSVYAHFQDGMTWGPGINPGTVVSQGRVLGYAGSTGLSTGPHLHFHMQHNLDAVNPEPMSGISGFGNYGANPQNDCPIGDPGSEWYSPLWPSFPASSDGDGYWDNHEHYFGTLDNDGCGYIAGGDRFSYTWPPDLIESDTINIQDVLELKPVFGASVPPADTRYDIVVSGSINIADVLSLKPLGRSCSGGSVPSSPGGGGGGGVAPSEPLLVGIDAHPELLPANTATSLGTRELCTATLNGTLVSVDVTIEGVPPVDADGGGLDAVQFELHYDPAIVNVIASDHSMFLAVNAGSSLVSLGDTAPDADGTFLVAVADFGASTAEDGEGVLARITFQGLSPGTALLTLEDVVLVDSLGNEYYADPVLDGCVIVAPP